MTPEKAHMLRCASSIVTAAYAKVGLIPQDSRSLPLELFAASSKIVYLANFYKSI
jgi:hypothetical protein